MRKISTALLALLLSATASGQGQAPLAAPKEVVAPAIPGVVAAGTRIELVKFPVEQNERRASVSPLGMPDGNGIIFTFTSVDHITRIDGNGNTSTFIEISNGSDGIAWDPKGRLISVQRAVGKERVGVLYPPASVATLVDSFEGKPFVGLNDLVVSAKGGIYFTDSQGVYYLAPGAPGSAVKKVMQGIENPNGITLSPDEKTAYANDKDGEYLLAFDVRPDGTLSNRRNFGKYKSVIVPGSKDGHSADDNGADGLAIDSDGRIYAPTNVGVEVFSPRGEHLGVIPIGIWGGGQNVLSRARNLTFSGPDRKTLYTIGGNAVYRVRLLSQGVKGRVK